MIGLDNGNDAGPYDFAIWTNTNNLGYVMTMKENGLIGIGTNNPQTHLHVYGNTATSHTYIRSEGLFGVFQSFSNGKSSLFFTDPNTGNLILRAGTIDSLFINPENGNVGLGGNLGIGTLSPTSKLHVANASGDTSIVVEKSDYSYGASILELKTSDGAGSFKKMHIGLGSGARGDQLSNKFYLLDYEKGIRMVIDDNGNVGIGTTSPTEKLTVAGNIYASGTVTQASDFRYKKNINPLENALEKVLSLHGVSFEWKREEYQEKHFTQGKNMGFIAQEAEKVVPEVVQTGKDGYKSMAYANLTALLVEAFKELNGKFEKTLRENEEMKQEINELKIQNQELLKRLTAYESKMKKIDSLLSNLNQKVVQ
ncbi:MAG: hypothetical protein A2Y41_11610 [Spirochaetes bacterium GWB1_36_13]|nr:MAG: hypothetical protein A2Y41_11610 [Spirochaetes bacterium GWB1_36_13]